MPSYEVKKEVVYTNVEHREERDYFYVCDGGKEKALTEEYVKSMGWRHDPYENKLYKYFDVRLCSQCDSKMMHDTHAEEFYCPIC